MRQILQMVTVRKCCKPEMGRDTESSFIFGSSSGTEFEFLGKSWNLSRMRIRYEWYGAYVACLHDQDKSGLFGGPAFIQPIKVI